MRNLRMTSTTHNNVQATTQAQREAKKRANALKEFDEYMSLLSEEDRKKAMNGEFFIVPQAEFKRMREKYSSFFAKI